jgi:hypothetical protein
MMFLYPRSRIVDTPVERPVMASVEDAVGRIGEVVAGMEAGKVAIDEAAAVIEGAKAFVEALRVGRLEQEIEALRSQVAALMALAERQVGS